MNDKQRAAFEKWASQYEYDLTWSNAIDCYAIMRTRVVFDAWNAAIASVVVDIPSFFSDRYETDVVYADDMEKALDEAGVRYE